jgi:hypothetical protein
MGGGGGEDSIRTSRGRVDRWWISPRVVNFLYIGQALFPF